MFKTYSIVCNLCHKKLWIGQGSPYNKPHIHKTNIFINSLEKFLFDHQSHYLVFGECDVLDIDDFEESSEIGEM